MSSAYPSDSGSRSKNKQIHEQTNKQTNNYFLDPKYLSQIKLDLHKIFRVTSCGCPKVIKIKNKRSNKQTNKQLNILDPKYLCQIKSDLHKTFRETSCGCPMINKTKKQPSPLTNMAQIRWTKAISPP